MDLKEIGVLSQDISNHWYYRAKAAAVIRILDGELFDSVLDVGAGSGFFSKYLLEKTCAKSACCVDINYSVDSEDLEFGKPIFYRRSIESSGANLILLMDVLEHVDNDEALLRACLKGAPKGALVLISVPAFQFLWSTHDDFLGHRRRYTLRQIERVAASAGLSVVRGMYYFGSALPSAAVLRMIENFSGGNRGIKSRLKVHNRWVNKFLWVICRAELSFMRSNRFAGLTAFCLARVPGEGN